MSGEKIVQSLCLRKKILKASRGLKKYSRIEKFSHLLPPVISNGPSLAWGDTKHLLPTSFRVALVCNFPALGSLYASRVDFETVRTESYMCGCCRILVL